MTYKWDGDDLWYVGDGYEGNNPHRYTGISVDEEFRSSPSLIKNKVILLKALNCHDDMLNALEEITSLLEKIGDHRKDADIITKCKSVIAKAKTY